MNANLQRRVTEFLQKIVEPGGGPPPYKVRNEAQKLLTEIEAEPQRRKEDQYVCRGPHSLEHFC
jgi:hypothetical protein